MSPSPYATKPWLKHYPKSIPENIPSYNFSNLGDFISNASAKFKEGIAYTTCLPNGYHASLTFSQMEVLSNNLAAYFLNTLGLKKGDRVALQMPNCQTYPISVFAVLKAGLTIVNLNPLYTESEIEHALTDSEAKSIIIIDIFAYKLKKILPKTAIKSVLVCSIAEFFSPLIKGIVYVKQKYIQKAIKNIEFPYIKIAQAVGQFKNEQNLSIKVCLEDIACLQYTGGTTGKTKGAELTHGNILANITQIREFSRLKVDVGKEVLLTVLPLYHIFSFTVNGLFFYSVGARNILTPSPRPILNLKKTFQKFSFTWITGVNTLFHSLCMQDWFIKNPPQKLKITVAGGMPLLSATAQKWSSIVGGELIEGYGLTETSPALTFNPIGGLIKSDSIGIPICSTEVKLVDLNEQEVPQGTSGELCAKGPQVMHRYWNNEEETNQVFVDGWFHTGDIAVMDEDGYFKIVDRKKDMILVSGFNVYPNEVEDCIQKIQAVLECAVIGVADGEKGETIKVFVVSNNSSLSSQDVIEHCRKYLTSYKVPKIVEFRTELPKSPVGKILKRELRN